MRLRLKKIFFIFVLLGCINLPVISAQEEAIQLSAPKKPVMYSVFWNTLWGSAWGATMGFSYHLVSGIQLRESLITSTTIGASLLYMLLSFMFRDSVKEKLAPKFLKFKEFFIKNDTFYFTIFRFMGGGGAPYAIQNIIPVLFDMSVKNNLNKWRSKQSKSVKKKPK